MKKAAKVLSNPQSTEEDKAKANRELQKTLNNILGKNSESDIRDVFEEIQKTNLGSFGDIKEKIQNIIDDLYHSGYYDGYYASMELCHADEAAGNEVTKSIYNTDALCYNRLE